MKKILILALLAIMAVGTAQAQIQIGDKKGKTVTVASVRAGFVTIHHNVGKGYWMALRSDNQFEDSLIINLGEDKQSAIKSIESFLTLLETMQKDESVDFNDGRSQFTVDWDTMFGGAILIFNKVGESHAGLYMLCKPDCRSAIKKLEKYTE